MPSEDVVGQGQGGGGEDDPILPIIGERVARKAHQHGGGPHTVAIVAERAIGKDEAPNPDIEADPIVVNGAGADGDGRCPDAPRDQSRVLAKGQLTVGQAQLAIRDLKHAAIGITTLGRTAIAHDRPGEGAHPGGECEVPPVPGGRAARAAVAVGIAPDTIVLQRGERHRRTRRAVCHEAAVHRE